MARKLSKTRLVKALASRSYRPLDVEGLGRLLGLGGDELGALRDLVEELERKGVVYVNPRGKVVLCEKAGMVAGVLEVLPQGYGFVRPDDPEHPDLFVPRSEMGDALDGDRVLVKRFRESDGRFSGSVVKVLSRGRERMVGRLVLLGEDGLVCPQDPRYDTDVVVPAGMTGGARDGQVVVVRIVKHKEGKNPPVGEVVKVLGYPDDPGVDVASVVEEFGVVSDFPAEAEEEASRAYRLFSSGPRREDLEDLYTITIDPRDAKDFDDAVSVADEGDAYRVWVHIADVSHFVEEGGALDAEAARRAFSVYLPGQVVPMLPPALSSDLCSLKEGVLRLAFTAEMELSKPSLTVRSFRLYKSIVRVDRRLYYEQAQRILDGLEEAPEEVVKTLSLMSEVASSLREMRLRSGALELNVPEPRIVLDDRGFPVQVDVSPRVFAYRIIEEFMVLANRVVAEAAWRWDLPFVYRVHEEPSPEKLEEFAHVIGGLPIPRRLAHRLSRGGVTPGKLSELLDFSRGKPYERLLSMMLLRTLPRARYDVEPLGHFGLALDFYCHFTSPIRRYADLLVHRVLSEHLEGGMGQSRKRELKALFRELSAHVSAREAFVDEVEREAIKSKLMRFMSGRIGEVMDGVISGLTPSGLFVELECTAEGFVPIYSVEDDYYVFDRRNQRFVGRRSGRVLRLGDPVRVEVVRVNESSRTMELALASEG